MNVRVDRTLDCVGFYCPEPVFRTRIELDKMGVGEVLKVIADDPAAEADLKSLVKNLGQELVKFDSEEKRVQVLIRKIK